MQGRKVTQEKTVDQGKDGKVNYEVYWVCWVSDSQDVLLPKGSLKGCYLLAQMIQTIQEPFKHILRYQMSFS